MTGRENGPDRTRAKESNLKRPTEGPMKLSLQRQSELFFLNREVPPHYKAAYCFIKAVRHKAFIIYLLFIVVALALHRSLQISLRGFCSHCYATIFVFNFS
jgi:hypothetical protein